ncbi:MAG: hypothetical protein J3R72DRAFT_203113 [Linnemannia gamsii]|nr:MAG: hypothetical protein J3R72DRAFT_203113 [Linnemannia gamsii]
MAQQAPVVLIGTFNMNQRPIEQDLSDWLATHPSLSSVTPETPPSSPTPSSASAATATPFNYNSNTTTTNAPPIMPDIVAIALQEFVPYPDAFIHDTYQIRTQIDELANLIVRTLHRTCPGYRFSLVSQTAQVGMILFVLTRDGSMTECIERISNASVGTGPAMMGNKGAIATKLSIRLPFSTSSSSLNSSYSSSSTTTATATTTTTTTTTSTTTMGTTTYTGIQLGTDNSNSPSSSNNSNEDGHHRTSFDICFINAHLSAHLNKIKRRNDDYLAICRRMVFLNDRDNHVEGLLFEHQERLSTAASSPAGTISAASVVGGGVSAYDSLEDLNTEEDDYHLDSDSRPLLGGGGSGGAGGKKASSKGSGKAKGGNHRQHRRHSHSRRHSHDSSDGKKGKVWEESIFSCDYIFWTGDLNYRLDLAQSDGTLSSYKKKNKRKSSQSTEDLLSQSTMPDLTASEIVHAIKNGQLRQLYSHDQLSAQRKTLNVFKGFHEAPLAFPPTYKCRMGSSTEYDISKRVPAWTDRVLWFVHPKDATTADEDHEDELEAWDEHSRELGTGTLPLESSPSTRTRSGNYSSMASSLSSWSGSKSRGTFSSLSKRGSGPARGGGPIMTSGLFQQSPVGSGDGYNAGNNNNNVRGPQQPLSTARSNQTLTSLSSRNSSSHLQQQGLTQSPTTSSPLGEPCTSPLQIHYYTSHPHYASSDHKPVSALFTLLPHNLAASHHEPNPYGIDPSWKSKKWFGKKLTTVVGHMLRWGFLALGLGVMMYLSVLIRRHLHGW